jgi:hypothetical protein
MNFDLRQMQYISKAMLFIFWALVIILSVLAYLKYSGQGYIYVSFTVISNALLYFGFRRNAIFFDTFIGVFFWLGFWLKLTLRVAFLNGLFNQAVGDFDGSGAAFDQALLVSSCGLLGLLAVSFIRGKLVFNYPKKIDGLTQQGLFSFYQNHRKAVLTGFVVLFFIVAVTNAYLGIYQRGSITRTTLPFGLNGVYKWLLMFGLASFSALILRFEFEINKKTSFMVVILSLLESFVSNVSLLSRGMILNASALLYGVFTSLKLNSIKSSVRFFVATFLVFGALFVSSVYMVNYLRTTVYLDYLDSYASDSSIGDSSISELRMRETNAMTTPLFVDRWVGMEGVMAVSSYPNLGWDLWKTAWKETYNENETSFYDNNVIESAYVNTDKTKHHFISLPGIIAFFFYPGSFLFLFASMFVLGAIAAAIEIAVYKLGGMNVILCALLAQVVAFRFASFGYVPAQSYLLFGTLFLNLFIIYFADKFLLNWYGKTRSN